MTAREVDGFLVNGSISAMSNLHGVLVNVTDDVLEGKAGGERRQFILSPQQAIDLARNLTTAAVSGLERLLFDAQAGECETCHNARMVEVVQSHGGTRREHCPTCVPRTQVPVPTMEGWLYEREVLGR